jgi:FMN reductase
MPNAQPIRAVAISGSPARLSRSRTLLQHALALLAREGVPGRLIDLAEIPADDLLGRTRSAVIADAIGQVAVAQIVVASTPVYRASYSGLLKVFFDLLPPAALAGKVSVPMATARARLDISSCSIMPCARCWPASARSMCRARYS